MRDIKFTIITASYNYENYIKETIESVINQTHQDWEMIIVDDGSNNKNLLSNLLKTNKESNRSGFIGNLHVFCNCMFQR